MSTCLSHYAILALLALGSRLTTAIDLNLDDDNSIRSAAKTIAGGMMDYYTGDQPGQTPGLLPYPYYWWEAGAMFGTLIDYWYYTGDTKYNDVVTQALLFQVGPDENYMPPNQSSSLGNDDQAFWGLAAMNAAELVFPNPPSDQPQWLALAQAVFNSQALRWDKSTCGGGLRWQIFSFNTGYDYKNSISNGCFFNLAARLGAYTGNATYFEWAARAWDWTQTLGLISPEYQVFDGSDDSDNCSSINGYQWTYNMGIFLLGASVMWNQTEGAEQEMWLNRTSSLLNASSTFFPNGIMSEITCEPLGNCNTDQQSFKAHTSRWMAASTKVAPWTYDTIMPLLRTSAQAAAVACSGGTDGQQCGTLWTNDTFDGQTGVGQQMNALEVIQANLISKARDPLSGSTGGTSKGDPSAGGSSSGEDASTRPITTTDRGGAGFLTALMLISVLGFAWWLIL